MTYRQSKMYIIQQCLKIEILPFKEPSPALVCALSPHSSA